MKFEREKKKGAHRPPERPMAVKLFVSRRARPFIKFKSEHKANGCHIKKNIKKMEGTCDGPPIFFCDEILKG
jgi:hypothetical protein